VNFKDYNDFRPIEYLYQFYHKENKETNFLLDFLVASSLKIWEEWKGEKKCILELGGGPSLFSIIPLSLIAKEIYFSDNLDINLNVVEQWLNKKEFFLWDHIIEKALFFEYKKLNSNPIDNYIISPRLIEHRKEVIRRRWKKLFNLDLKKTSLELTTFDLVSCHFVPECITNSYYEFLYILQNIFSFCKEKGYLLLSFFIEAKYLKIGRSLYPTYYLTYEHLIKILELFNIKIINIQKIPSIFHYGYKEIVCILAQNDHKVDTFLINKKSHSYFFNLFYILNNEKKNYILYKGLMDKTTFLQLSGFKIKNELSNNIYDEIIYDKVHLYLDENYIYVPKNSFDLIQSYKDIFFNDFNRELILSMNYYKNKSYYFQLLIKEYSKNFSFVYLSTGFLLVGLNSKEIYQKYLNIIYDYGFSNKLFFYKDFLIIPLIEIKSTKELNLFFNLIELFDKKSIIKKIESDIKITQNIVINFYKNKKLLFYKDYIIDVDEKRFNYEQFSNKNGTIRNFLIKQ